ncbi:MAG: hypothetical protein WDN00_11825 [Limisphaerales bacterium]
MNEFPQTARRVFVDWFGDGPWRSKSVLAALVVVVAGVAFWISDIKPKPPTDKIVQTSDAPKITSLDDHWNWTKPFPFYVRMGASYVAAYCIGWLFRRLIKLILIVSVLVIALLAYGKFVDLDTTHTQEKVKQSGEWVRQTATTEKDHLKSLLPSATAGAVGMFMGFWRRNKFGTSQSGRSQ